MPKSKNKGVLFFLPKNGFRQVANTSNDNSGLKTSLCGLNEAQYNNLIQHHINQVIIERKKEKLNKKQ